MDGSKNKQIWFDAEVESAGDEENEFGECNCCDCEGKCCGDKCDCCDCDDCQCDGK